MNSQHEQAWIDAYINGLIAPEDLAALENRLRESAEFRARFRRHLALDANLRQTTDVFASEAAAADGSRAKVLPFRKGKAPFVWGTLAAAACLGLGAFLVSTHFTPSTDAPAVATLIQTDNCRWEGTALPTLVDSRLGSGVLSLVQGIATLQFESGAVVTIEAPSRLELVDAMHCRLLEGSAIADVPESAHGFVIDTQDLKVVDLGTKFAVTTGATGYSQVRVFEGEVDVLGLPGSDRKRLVTGQGANVGGATRVPDHEMPRPRQAAEPVQESGGWTGIMTSHGRGADAYVRRGPEAPRGTDPLLMVKHTHLEEGLNNERRAILTFDLSQRKPIEVQEAQLVLDIKASGLGFSTLVPDDSKFAVYGLLDESRDGWDEDSIAWDNLPGATDAGLVPEQTRKLAEFWIPRGGAGGTFVIRSDEFAPFIREDTNGLVTFLIVRETSETHPSGLVHAFASKEHPTGRPPVLRIR